MDLPDDRRVLWVRSDDQGTNIYTEFLKIRMEPVDHGSTVHLVPVHYGKVFYADNQSGGNLD